MSVVISKPVRPGTYIDIVGQSLPSAPISINNTVAIPITHNWGPENVTTIETSMQQFTSDYGDLGGIGRDAILSAFTGGGLAGSGGAGAVVVYRLVGSAGAVATITLNNTTPAAALRLDGKYKGTRGNSLTVTTQSDPVDGTRQILKVLYSGVVKEQYSFLATDTNGLAADINAASKLLKATVLITGVGLATVTAIALAGGNDGTTLAGGDYSAALNALRFQPFIALGFMDLTDGAIQATVLQWVRDQMTAGRPIQWLQGGLVNESLSTALTRSTTNADIDVINLGVGSVHDDLLGRDLSTSQLVPRATGMLVAQGETASLTFAKMAGVHVLSGPDDNSLETAIRGGVTALSHALAADADTKVEKGVTTFTSTSDAAHPIDIFSDPRLVFILNLFLRTMKEWGDNFIIGRGPVNDNARAAVKGKGETLIGSLESRGLIIPKTGFITVDDPDDPALLDAIPYDFGWQFARTSNYIFGHGLIS